MATMKRVFGLAALGCAIAGVESKLLSWGEDEIERRWTPAYETLGILPLLGQTPRPTDPPRLEDRAVGKRSSSDNTCAYVNGDPEIPLYCAATDQCVYNSVNHYIGCCADAETICPVWTTCYDRTDSASFTTDNSFTLWCGQTSFPYCKRHLYQDKAWTGYTLWGCAVAAGTDTVYYTPTETASPTTETSPTSSHHTTTTGHSSSSPTRTSAGPNPTSETPKPSGGKGVPVGPVVGGVVGGVAAIGLIGLGAFYLIRSNRKNNNNPPTGAAAGQGPPPGAPSGGYDPNQGQMMAQQHGGYYAPGAAAGVAGFTPVDPRASMLKPQGFDNGNSPPGSPTPTYQSVTTPPPAGYGGQPSPTSTNNMGYAMAPQDFQQQQQQQQMYHGTPPPQQGYQAAGAAPYNNGQGNPHSPQGQAFAAELPTTRGDGQVNELAG